MKRLRVSLAILGVSLFLTGCGDYEAVQRGVIENNQKVDTVLDSYEASQKAGKELEQLVLQSVEESDTSLIRTDSSINEDVELLEDIENKIVAIIEPTYDFIAMNNEMSKSQEGMETVVPVPLIEPNAEFFNSVIEVFYFLDDRSGVTEQMFLVQLPNGYIGGFSIHWLGGAVIDVQEYSN